MAIITDAFVAALKKVKADADNLSEAELAQLTRRLSTKRSGRLIGQPFQHDHRCAISRAVDK